jgi:hypothetical protein
MMQRRNSFVEGIFVGLEPNGELAESFASVAYNPAMPGIQPGPIARHVPVAIEIGNEQEPVEAFGLPDIVAELNAGKTDRATTEKMQIDDLRKHLAPNKFDRILAIRMVDLTIAYHPKQGSVGGPVDAIELLRGGVVQWLQRKQSCPAR